MARGLPISTLVDINTEVAAGGVLRTQFGTGLLVVVDPAIPAGGPRKMEAYRDAEAVAAIFGSGSVLDDAQVWFARSGVKSLYIGRWATADVSTTLRGGTAGAQAELAVNNASFRIGGMNVTVDLSADANYTDLADGLETAIQALGGDFAGATVVYEDGAFLLTMPGAQDVGYVSAHSEGAGTDISALLAMRQDSTGVVYLQGHDAESLASALSEMIALAPGTAPVALMLGTDAPATVGAGADEVDSLEALAAYAQAGDFVSSIVDTSSQALVTGDATSRSALIFQRGQSHVGPVYSMPGERPDIGILSFLSEQNLDQPQSIATPHGKSLPGVRPTPITETQRLELERKRTNVYTTIGGLGALAGGYSGRAGSWLDAIWWLLWLKNELELAIFNGIRGSRRYSTAILADNVGEVMEAAVRSGGVEQGGTVSPQIREDIRATFNRDDFDGTLAAGFLIWTQPTSARSQLDRENRVGRFKVWISPADAIHHVSGDIVLSG